MPALEILQGQVTFSNTVEVALTMAAGNSLTIRNCPPEARPILIGFWALPQFAGIVKIRSPRLHDDVEGIRFRTVAAVQDGLLLPFGNQKLFPQDTLRASISAADAAGDIEIVNLLIYYPELPGANARLVNYSDIKDKIVNIVTVETPHATGGAGGWSGQIALNTTFDLLKANTDYALLGYQADVTCAAVRISGSDSGNLGLGGPGLLNDKHVTQEWFVRISNKTGLPLIPVFNSANAGGILCDVAVDENGLNPNVNWIFAQLG